MWVACGDKKKDRFIRSQKMQALVHWTFNTKLLEKDEQKEHSKVRESKRDTTNLDQTTTADSNFNAERSEKVHENSFKK